MSAREAWARAAAAAAVVVVLDQVLKQVAIDAVERGDREQLVWFVDLVNVRNTGVAFGQLQDGGAIVGVVVAVALTALLVFFARNATRPLMWLAVGVLLGGAIGNAIDRIRIGAVIDFIKLPHWPAFNLADMAITSGVVLLVLLLERGSRDDHAPADPA